MRGQDKIEFYYKYNKIFLVQCGIWPYQKLIVSKIFRYFWLSQEIFILITKMIKFYEIRHEIDLVIESIVSFFYNIVVTIKFMNAISNEKKVRCLKYLSITRMPTESTNENPFYDKIKIKVIFEKVKKDWEETLDPIENEILTQFADLGKLLNFLYLSAVLSTLVGFMCLPLAPIFLDIILPLNETRPRKPLIMAEFFIDEKKYFHSLVVHAFITAYYGIIPLLGTDLFYMNCVYHACGMFTILGRRIENAFEDNHENEWLERENYQRIRTCIKQHQEIIEFCDVINEAFSKSFFVVLIICMTLMSITGISSVINFGDINLINEVIKFGMFTISQAFHVFCYNYMGQIVLDSGEKITDNIYNAKWYETSIKTKELVKFMLLRSSRPNMMQARIFVLCLPVFTSVMKSSMSYFTVLRSTR